MTATLRDTAGMTLVEVIVAVGVVLVGLVALIATMPLATSVIAESNLKTTAAFLAQQRLEQIKNAQWTAAPAVDNLGGAGSDGAAAVSVAGFPDRWPDEAAVASYPRFQRQVRIKDCSVAPICIAGVNPPTGLTTLRRVTVTVAFAPMTGVGTSNSATLENVQLITFIAQRP